VYTNFSRVSYEIDSFEQIRLLFVVQGIYDALRLFVEASRDAFFFAGNLFIMF